MHLTKTIIFEDLNCYSFFFSLRPCSILVSKSQMTVSFFSLALVLYCKIGCTRWKRVIIATVSPYAVTKSTFLLGMISSGRKDRERSKSPMWFWDVLTNPSLELKEILSVCIHTCLMYTLESDLGTSNLQNIVPSAHSTNTKAEDLVNVL